MLAGQAGEAAVETPHRFVDIGLYGEIPVVERPFFINPGHTPPFRCPVPDPGNIETRQLNQHVARVVPPCEPADRHRPIEPDHTRCNRVFNIRKFFEMFGGRDQVSCRLRGDRRGGPAPTHPTTHTPPPSASDADQPHATRSSETPGAERSGLRRQAVVAQCDRWWRSRYPYDQRIKGQ